MDIAAHGRFALLPLTGGPWPGVVIGANDDFITAASLIGNRLEPFRRGVRN